MSRLLAIDWGSSSLRGALIDDAGTVLEQRSAPKGMLTVDAGGFDAVFEATFGDWMDVPGTRCLMAGMVGSRQGWVEAPYQPCPAGLDDYATGLQRVGADRSSRGRDIAIVPGSSCEHDGMPDVIRGEEIKVFGALDLLGAPDARMVSPGTHSKWCTVERGRLVEFSTAMSGEFYALLSRHSILVHSLPDDDDALDEGAFDAGVERAFAGKGLLQNAFSVRTFALFDRMPKAARASYLSGLVIGEELRDRDIDAAGEVTLVGATALTSQFARALRSRGVPSRSFGDEAAWRGLWRIDQRRLELEERR